MVQANPRHKITLNLGDSHNCRVEMALEQTLNPGQQMTGLLYAISQLKELAQVEEITLMFDDDNMTNEEEIIEQGITDVLVKVKQAPSAQLSMADLIIQSQNQGN